MCLVSRGSPACQNCLRISFLSWGLTARKHTGVFSACLGVFVFSGSGHPSVSEYHGMRFLIDRHHLLYRHYQHGYHLNYHQHCYCHRRHHHHPHPFSPSFKTEIVQSDCLPLSNTAHVKRKQQTRALSISGNDAT